ncbi:glycosyltransferase [Sabulilitoribacter multivorans]|uniref:Glycosyltransferase n=1 Tax=Flaviramulus multivorans TaxID=1304750 RepID=A0ABS9II50_9FLAO|nr:glycosyltransferase family 2 protein [Flaviramulus multivorans]MCF7560325.1 glycosyltransferase [Flaviramulus multivorans]
MLDDHLISIITVNYNNKLGLERTLKSVQSQTYTNFEHIVVDGESTDGSKEIIESNKQYFTYWVSEPDKGIYNAMNKGIKAAKGDYLFFLNSGDDFLGTDSLENISTHLKTYDFIYFNINVKDGNNSYVKKCPSTMSFSFLHNDTIPHQSIFIKKSLFKHVGNYDENLKIVSDWKFLILALIKHNATYKHIDAVFTNFYRGGISSLEANKVLVNKEREQVLKQEFSVILNDLNENLKLQRTLRTLRKSRKIKLLIRLGLINKF